MDLYEKILENPLFFPWVYNSNEQLDLWWANYIMENPEEAELIKELKFKFQDFKSTGAKLKKKEKKKIAQQILYKIEQNRGAIKAKKTAFSFLKYAAIAILFFTLGSTLVYVLMNDQIKEIYLPETQSMVNLNEPILILPKGENVKLVEKESSIQKKLKILKTILIN